jgi:hypothetical protein
MTSRDSVERMFRMPSGSFFLFGPRWAGKPAWLNMAFRDALYVDLFSERLKSGGVLCVPCTEFLRGIVPGKPLPVR